MADTNVTRGRLPDVGVEGQVVLEQVEACAERLKTGCLSYCYRAKDALLSGESLAPRLLLRYRTRTPAAREIEAQGTAIAYGVVAGLPATLVLDLFARMWAPEAALWFAGAVIVGGAWHGYQKVQGVFGSIWNQTEWLDFDARAWRSRRVHTDGCLPPLVREVPLDDCMLVCCEGVHDGAGPNPQSIWIEGPGPSREGLTLLYSSLDQAEAHAIVRALAARWRMKFRGLGDDDGERSWGRRGRGRVTPPAR